jgi:hypothetical protein
MTRRSVAIAAGLACCLASFPSRGEAQRAVPLGQRPSATVPSLLPPPLRFSYAERDSIQPKNISVSHFALVGAGIGAGAGLLAGAIASTQSHVTDHSEDAIAYIAFASAGALIGLVAGTIVGLTRR